MDDDEPLPAPPEFDGNAGRVPDLLDADDVILDDAEVLEDPELLDSALVTLRPRHPGPPPIPAPLPGNSSRSFTDDGEIALPPQISRYVQSFPFRKVRAEPDPSAEETLDEASPDTTGWRSAALNVEVPDDDDDDDVTDELEPDELEAEELEADDEEAVATPPELRQPPPRFGANSFANSSVNNQQPRDELRPVDDDDDTGLAFGAGPTTTTSRRPPAPRRRCASPIRRPRVVVRRCVWSMPRPRAPLRPRCAWSRTTTRPAATTTSAAASPRTPRPRSR